MSEMIPKPAITVSNVTEADLKEALMGTAGDPTYAEQFGISSAPLGTPGYVPKSMAQLELEASQAIAQAQAAAVAAQMANRVPDPFNGPNEELDRFKKLYGDSENEKGALRKQLAEMAEAFNGMAAQYEASQAAQGQQWGPPAPQYGMPPQQMQPVYNDPFEGLGDDDVVQGKQVRRLVEQQIGPAFGQLLQQNQAAFQKIQALEASLVKQAKEASGLTPVDEFRLISKNPWIRNLQPAQRAQALGSLRQAELASQPQIVQQPAPIPAPTDSQQRILNKVTYVEGATPTVPDTSEAAIEAAKQRDYAKVMQAPSETGERAKMFRAYAAKYGINLGTPSDIAH